MVVEMLTRDDLRHAAELELWLLEFRIERQHILWLSTDLQSSRVYSWV